LSLLLNHYAIITHCSLPLCNITHCSLPLSILLIVRYPYAILLIVRYPYAILLIVRYHYAILLIVHKFVVSLHNVTHSSQICNTMLFRSVPWFMQLYFPSELDLKLLLNLESVKLITDISETTENLQCTYSCWQTKKKVHPAHISHYVEKPIRSEAVT